MVATIIIIILGLFAVLSIFFLFRYMSKIGKDRVVEPEPEINTATAHPTPPPAHATPAPPAHATPAHGGGHGGHGHATTTGHKKNWWKAGLWALFITLLIVLIRQYGSYAMEFCGFETPKSGTVLATVRNFFGGSWGWILVAFFAIWIFLVVSWGWRIFVLILVAAWFWWSQPAEPVWVEVYTFSKGIRNKIPSEKRLVPFVYDLQQRVEFEVIGGKAIFDFPHYGETTFSPGEKCDLPKGSVYKGKIKVRRARWWD